MNITQFREILTEELGFWPEDKDSDRIYIKNAQCLSVIYILVTIVDDFKIVITERTEKTIIGDLKCYDKVVHESDLDDSQLLNQIENILNFY